MVHQIDVAKRRSEALGTMALTRRGTPALCQRSLMDRGTPTYRHVKAHRCDEGSLFHVTQCLSWAIFGGCNHRID